MRNTEGNWGRHAVSLLSHHTHTHNNNNNDDDDDDDGAKYYVYM